MCYAFLILNLNLKTSYINLIVNYEMNSELQSWQYEICSDCQVAVNIHVFTALLVIQYYLKLLYSCTVNSEINARFLLLLIMPLDGYCNNKNLHSDNWNIDLNVFFFKIVIIKLAFLSILKKSNNKCTQ